MNKYTLGLDFGTESAYAVHLCMRGFSSAFDTARRRIREQNQSSEPRRVVR